MEKKGQLDIKCDFCSGRPVTARYHAEDFEAHAFSNTGLHHLSVGDWAACARCERAIDKGDWDAIINHAVDTFMRDMVQALGPLSRADYRESRNMTIVELRVLYAQLRESGFRKGKL